MSDHEREGLKPSEAPTVAKGDLEIRGNEERASDPKKVLPDGVTAVVGIGASAGGLEAFKQFLSQMPTDSGLALVLILHLDPNHQSLMVDLLSKYTSMPVREVEDGVAIEANAVYMIPPSRALTIEGVQLHLTDPVTWRGMRMPIDHFFRSLAAEYGQRSIGIILSGTGTDGSLGFKAIKEAGGMTMVEYPQTAQYNGMPRSAIANNAVDMILPVNEMPEALVRYTRHPYLNGDHSTTVRAERSLDHFTSILSILRTHTDRDMRSYKQGTLIRRIERRMGLHHIDDMDAYVELLREDPEETKSLFKDMLIGVTAFFRDPEAFEALSESALSKLIAEKPKNESLRVCVPGCATGEEPYSIAMLLSEQFAAQDQPFNGHCRAADSDRSRARDAPDHFRRCPFTRNRRHIRASCRTDQ